MPAPTPANEPRRIAALRACDILDTAEEEIYDQITEAAAQACNVPIALLSFVDTGREWCKSHYGTDFKQAAREVSFCAYTIIEEDFFIVPDALEDERFRGNPLVTGGESFRFYAGFPLRTKSGEAIGTLCVLDRVPRTLSKEQRDTLRKLTDSAMRLVSLRNQFGSELFAAAVNFSGDAISIADVTRDGASIIYVNRSFLGLSGCKYHEVIGKPFYFPCPHDLSPKLLDALSDRVPFNTNCDYHHDGRPRFDNVMVIPYMNRQCEVTHCVVIHRDLTTDKEAETQRHQLHAMRTTVRSVNHVVLNFLNTATIFRQNAEGAMDSMTLRQFDLSIQNMRSQLTELAAMDEFKERATPFGFTVLDPEAKARGTKG